MKILRDFIFTIPFSVYMENYPYSGIFSREAVNRLFNQTENATEKKTDSV